MLGKLSITSTYPRATQVTEEYRRWVVGQSKANLGRGSNSASGALKSSVKGYIKKRFNRGVGGMFTGGTTLPSLRFEYLKYGDFIDEGVQGSDTTYSESMGSEYKYRNGFKSVPVKAIQAWCAQRGLPKTMAFVVARSVYKKGIKAKKWFTTPFESRFGLFVRRYHSAVADDIQNNIANKMAKKLKQNKLKK